MPARERFGLAGDLLGIDRVRLDPGPGVRLVVAGALERGLLVADLDLEALAGTRLLGDRAERLERAASSAAISSAAASRVGTSDSGGSLPTSPSSWAASTVDLRDVRLLAGEQVLGRREVGEPERPEPLGGLRLDDGQLGLHLGSTAQPAVDLDVAQLGAHVVAAAQPQRDRGEDQADAADDPADEARDRARGPRSRGDRARPRRRR